MARRKQEGAERQLKFVPERRRRTPPRRRLLAEKVEDAEHAFALVVEWMDDGENSMAFRRACAHDVMDRVWGKARELGAATRDTAGTDVDQLSDEEREARVAAILDKARARANGRADHDSAPGGCVP